MQLTLIQLALANLRSEISKDERGYCSQQDAREWLKELTGVDLGSDPNLWED